MLELVVLMAGSRWDRVNKDKGDGPLMSECDRYVSKYRLDILRLANDYINNGAPNFGANWKRRDLETETDFMMRLVWQHRANLARAMAPLDPDSVDVIERGLAHDFPLFCDRDDPKWAKYTGWKDYVRSVVSVSKHMMPHGLAAQ